MSNPGLREHSRRLCRLIMNGGVRSLEEQELAKRALIISPHQDDETLGCGGTIIKKRMMGADVKLAFMADGSGSHASLIPGDRLREMRSAEALMAARALGVDAGEVTFLGFEEGRLARHQGAAIEAVAELLRRHRPAQVFIPYRWESLSDHSATNRIVRAALRKYEGEATIYEYPVWFWHQWPWVSHPLPWAKQKPRALRARLGSLRAGLASKWAMLTDFKCSVYIGDVLARKREALDKHRSQMTRLVPDPRWMTLSDVANGDFLECFFQQHEIFFRWTLASGR